jgi:hypothetical protein
VCVWVMSHDVHGAEAISAPLWRGGQVGIRTVEGERSAALRVVENAVVNLSAESEPSE